MRPLCLIALLAIASPTLAQPTQSSASPATRTDGADSTGAAADTATALQTLSVTAGAAYRAGGFHRFLYGDLWRDVWTTPVRVHVLDLDTFAGGLTPTEQGGGLQTLGLHLRGADGREYKFRSVNKNPEKAIPAAVRNTFIERITQDLTASIFPGGALVAEPIMDAEGVLNAPVQLVVMPDSPKLGQFRAKFGRMLGTIEVKPDEGPHDTPGFAGSSKIKGTLKVLGDMENDNRERVDARAYLTARLVDAVLGDWDRHVDQWRWASRERRVNGVQLRVWEPIPADRDQALARFDGLVPTLATHAITQIQSADKTYPPAFNLSWSGRYTDRVFLPHLDRATWDSVTDAVIARLTDSVIRNAAHRLPPEWYAVAGSRVEKLLIARRDGLRDYSHRYYRLLAGTVDIYGSDRSELALVDRLANDRVRVRLWMRDDSTYAPIDPPMFDRTFDADETGDIRIYLRGGDDRAEVSGRVERSIDVRVIGGGGDDTLIDRSHVAGWTVLPFIPGAETATRFYDEDTKDGDYELAAGTSFDDSKWDTPSEDEPEKRYQPTPRDWGSSWGIGGWIWYDPDLGVTLGIGPTMVQYGFRADPYVYRMQLLGGYATGINGFEVDYDGWFRNIVRGAELHAEAHGSELGIVDFYGIGNTVDGDSLEPDEYYEAPLDRIRLETSLRFPAEGAFNVELGVFGRYTHARLTADHPTLLGETRPYGVEELYMAGARSSVEFDTRDHTRTATHGAFIDITGDLLPAILDNRETYGAVRGEARTYLTLHAPTDATLALRIAGAMVSDGRPFFESAFIGGYGSLRGYETNRFAGDASLVGNAELRVKLFDHGLILPGEFGLSAFAEAGRVFVRESEEGAGQEFTDGSAWHPSYGGGAWISFVRPEYLLSVYAAHSTQQSIAWYLGIGFMY